MYVIAVVDNQYGDTGKGKLVDLFTLWADISIRGTGGANAGHTIVWDRQKLVVHLLPSSCAHPDKQSWIGRGVAFDPYIALSEMKDLDKMGLTYDNLKISKDATLVLPTHKILDGLKEADRGKDALGTTLRGVGPAYEDDVGRVGLRVNDMLNKDVFVKKLKGNLDAKKRYLGTFEDLEAIVQNPALERYVTNKGINVEAIVTDYCETYGPELKERIVDLDRMVREALGKKKILLEGAQGRGLSIKYGSRPFVTSSDPTIRGLAEGCGLTVADVDYVVGVVKAFYQTRVGEGPFVTELGRKKSAEHCRNSTKEDEDEIHADINSDDDFEVGVAIRQEGGSYGATTRRPRRTGWLNIPELRRSAIYNGNRIALTKVDVLGKKEVIKICDHYVYEGPDYQMGEEVITAGHRFDIEPEDTEVIEHCKPHYIPFPGWMSDISDVRQKGDLPWQVRDIIEYIEKTAEVEVDVIGVGPGREEVVFMR